MWKNILKINSVALALVATSSFAQAQNHAKCGNELDKMIQVDPALAQAAETFYNGLQSYLDGMEPGGFSPENGARIIPVVVHVLHEGGQENILKAQIESQIVQLNKDFKKLNAGLNNLNGTDTARVLFKQLAADCNIEFRLATIDPMGNCTDGIVRVYTTKTNLAKDFTDFKRASYWDRSKYLNIWIVRDIYNEETGTILGYAQFPFQNGNQFPLTSTDGITVIHNSFGTIGTANGGTGATSSHEIGHWLGLRHIWGDATCGSDMVDDTPVHNGPNYCGGGCPFPIPKVATCININDSTDIDNMYKRDSIGEMWMNFMDYTDDRYLWMFTQGQKEVMDFTFSNYAFRGNLINPANNIATGTDDDASACTTIAQPDFWSRDNQNLFINFKMICKGGTINFRNGTYNGTADASAWDFPGGSPATSTQTTPSVTYNNVGVYDVSLATTTSGTTISKTRPNYVRVVENGPEDVNYIYFDSFEGSQSLYEQGKWIIANNNEGQNVTWEQATNTGYESFKCMKLKNTGNIRFEEDMLISPSYDMTTFDNDQLTFKYAYAAKTNSPYIDQKDRLRVYTSTDCGATWQIKAITVDGTTMNDLTGTRLLTAGLAPNGFVPQGTGEWKTGRVNLNTAGINTSNNLRVMFAWQSGGPYANDFYLDNVNIGSSALGVGIDDENATDGNFEVFPNPVSSTSNILFDLVNGGDVQVDVLDITGRTIFNVFSGNLNMGEHTYQVQHSQFGAAGIYIVRVAVNGKSSFKKIVVE